MTVVSLYQRIQLLPLGREVHIMLLGPMGRNGKRRPSVFVESVDRGDRWNMHRRVVAVAETHGIRWIDDPEGIVNRERGPCSYSFNGGRK